MTVLQWAPSVPPPFAAVSETGELCPSSCAMLFATFMHMRGLPTTYVCPDIFDKDGDPLAWRYLSNTKGSIIEEYCAMYIEDVLQPVLGYHRRRS